MALQVESMWKQMVFKVPVEAAKRLPQESLTHPHQLITKEVLSLHQVTTTKVNHYQEVAKIRTQPFRWLFVKLRLCGKSAHQHFSKSAVVVTFTKLYLWKSSFQPPDMQNA
jgi:hypothetical protein